METTTSPPLTPIRQYMISPIDTTSPSPTHSYRENLRRRTSSFSSAHDRSPVTPASRKRFSNASQLSEDFGPSVDEGGGGGGGMGNLADELDQLEDDDEYDEGITDSGVHNGHEGIEKEEVSRDSGIDVSYRDSAKHKSPTHARNFSKPFGADGEKSGEDQSEEADLDMEDRFSPELEDLMNTIARMTSYTSASEDPLIPRTIAQLQDLGNQTSLEAAVQRFTTSTNSMTAHLTSQSKIVQTLMQNLYPVFAFSAPLDPTTIDETLPLVEALQTEIPQPEVGPVQKLQRLDRETGDVITALSHLTDTLQMGKQITTVASRHLRNTQTMVLELRREQERAEVARHEVAKSREWEQKLQDRWCGAECQDIISGFEDRCNALRGSLEKAIEAGA